MSLSIDSEMVGGVVVAALAGQLDTLTAKTFETFLSDKIRNERRRIVVDLSEVKYVSSYGLRVFLQTAKQLRSDRRAFVLCGLTPEVQKIFRVSGFDKILSIRPTREDALAIAAS